MLLTAIGSFSQFDYSLRCIFPQWSHWDIRYTRKGLIKKRFRQALLCITFTASIVVLYQARQKGQSIGSLCAAFRRQARGFLSGLLNIMASYIRGD